MRSSHALPLIGVLALATCSSDSQLLVAIHPSVGFEGAVGVERVMTFSHASAAAHVGVDAVRMPWLDPVHGEMRDNHLLVSVAGTGTYAALVDDSWHKLSEAFWPVPGYSVPWSDVKVVRRRDAQGNTRVLIYYVSRGTNQIQITDATNFPAVTTVVVPVDIGLPIPVRGVHTLQIHEARGVMVLNGIDVGVDNLPPPLTFGSAPAAFYDIATDPMAPRLLSLFVGEQPGTQVMFDSQFLRIDGHDVWAPALTLPLTGESWFSFYDFANPADMQHARKLADYRQPFSGQAHNVVQLPPRPDGTPLLAAGFEAWAFTSQPGDVLSKAAVLDATGLWTGTPPQFVAWLAGPDNLRHAVHNPCARLVEVDSHSYDTVPLAHFTGGYFVYEYGPGTAKMLAHVPISRVAPSGRLGFHHASMSAPVWMAGYNGAWDLVATPIGDYVSCTDRQASYLIEPTYGFTRQFGTYIAQPDGTVPRVHVRGAVPRAGADLNVGVSGLVVGGRVELTVAKRIALAPTSSPTVGKLWFDPMTVLQVLRANVHNETMEFVVPGQLLTGGQLVLTAIERGGATPTSVLKSPAAVLRVQPAR